MSLSGNMTIKQMKSRRINWLTTDDGDEQPKPSDDDDDELDVVTLRPMGIRVFEVTYTAI